MHQFSKECLNKEEMIIVPTLSAKLINISATERENQTFQQIPLPQTHSKPLYF